MIYQFATFNVKNIQDIYDKRYGLIGSKYKVGENLFHDEKNLPTNNLYIAKELAETRAEYRPKSISTMIANCYLNAIYSVQGYTHEQKEKLMIFDLQENYIKSYKLPKLEKSLFSIYMETWNPFDDKYATYFDRVQVGDKIFDKISTSIMNKAKYALYHVINIFTQSLDRHLILLNQRMHYDIILEYEYVRKMCVIEKELKKKKHQAEFAKMQSYLKDQTLLKQTDIDKLKLEYSKLLDDINVVIMDNESPDLDKIIELQTTEKLISLLLNGYREEENIDLSEIEKCSTEHPGSEYIKWCNPFEGECEPITNQEIDTTAMNDYKTKKANLVAKLKDLKTAKLNNINNAKRVEISNTYKNFNNIRRNLIKPSAPRSSRRVGNVNVNSLN
jgi:hypothetical protein